MKRNCILVAVLLLCLLCFAACGQNGENSGLTPADVNSELWEEALSEAILSRDAGKDDAIRVESHYTLSTEGEIVDGRQIAMIWYGLVLRENFLPESLQEENPRCDSGSYIPTAVTFAIDEAGRFELEEYWIPGDGNRYAPDLEAKFPDSVLEDVWNMQAYIDELQEECLQKARAALAEY